MKIALFMEPDVSVFPNIDTVIKISAFDGA
jgi:hypothetical protein